MPLAYISKQKRHFLVTGLLPEKQLDMSTIRLPTGQLILPEDHDR